MLKIAPTLSFNQHCCSSLRTENCNTVKYTNAVDNLSSKVWGIATANFYTNHPSKGFYHTHIHQIAFNSFKKLFRYNKDLEDGVTPPWYEEHDDVIQVGIIG